MERSAFHYHVDILTPDSRPVASSAALPKSAAERLFRQKVEEYRQQTGKFIVRPATERDWARGFVGAVKVAVNHRLVISLTRCDCDEQ